VSGRGRVRSKLIGSPGASSPRLPQHPACGSARGVSAGWKRRPEEHLQSWLQHRPPWPFHLGRCTTTDEVDPTHSLPTVRAFTMSHPLRWALGYYAVC